MFGFKTVRAGTIEALQSKIDALETQVKGYYENSGSEINEYFKAIAPLLTGYSIRDRFGRINRVNIQECYESCAPAYGVINKIAKAVGEVFPYLELQDVKTGKYVESHPVVDLLARPNDRYSTQRFGTAWATNRLAYGDAASLPGPRFASARRVAGGVEITFANVGPGLFADGGKIGPHLFAVQGESGAPVWTTAELRPDGTVFVADGGVGPVAMVQYAYSAFPPNPSLRRKGDGLPVFPFRAKVKD